MKKNYCNNIFDEAMRYIECNFPEREKVNVEDKTIEVYFNGEVEFSFYLEDDGDFKSGDYVHYGNYCGNFLNYDFEAARQWDLENAGIEISPSY